MGCSQKGFKEKDLFWDKDVIVAKLPAPFCLLQVAKYLAEVRKKKERRELEEIKQVQKEARARAMSSCVASSSESSSEDSRLQSDSDSRRPSRRSCQGRGPVTHLRISSIPLAESSQEQFGMSLLMSLAEQLGLRHRSQNRRGDFT